MIPCLALCEPHGSEKNILNHHQTFQRVRNHPLNTSMENYTLLSKIGDGAEGVVFRVEHKLTKKEFAMKVVRCADHSKVNSALKEIKVLLKLHHQHVVSYVDFFLVFHGDNRVLNEYAGANENKAQPADVIEKSELCSTCDISGNEDSDAGSGFYLSAFCANPSEICVCLVMELCTCGDMQSTIREARQRFMEIGSHPISETQILSWMKQCISALAFIHTQGFLHRDLKPTNIFFDDNRNVKIGDFGLAATVGLGCQSIVGTPLYLAPERMLCQVYDEKVDVWGLGVVILELITLREQPINSQVLENPLVVETVVQQVTTMGFTAKLGFLLRDMLQRFSEDRPSSAVIFSRLSGMATATSSPYSNSLLSPSVTKNILNISSVMGESSDVEPAVLSCLTCGTVLCKECNYLRYKKGMCQSQEHPPLSHQCSLQATRVHSLKNIDSNTVRPAMRKANYNTVLTPSRCLIPKSRFAENVASGMSSKRSSNHAIWDLNSSTIRVPQDCPTIPAALNAACSLPYVRKIVVAGNTIHNTPLTLMDSLPDNVKLVGETPFPLIEVSDASCVIHCVSGRGTLENFVIRHTGRRASQAEEQNDAKAHNKPSRPNAISITGGEWKITQCHISCSAGSGISVASDLEAVVSRCTIFDVKAAGVVVVEGGRGFFEKNTVTNCGFAAFLLKKNSSVRVSGNRVLNSAQSGMFFQSASGLVENNFISNSGGCGVVTRGFGTNIIFRGNRVIANGEAGFFCCDGAVPIILENEIRQNKRAGIVVKTRASPRITKNIISCGNETGIYVFHEGAGFIEENELKDNNNAGILVTSGGCPHVVKNIIQGNLYEGVWVCKDGGGTFFDNDLRGNKKGPKDVEEGCLVVWVGNREA